MKGTSKMSETSTETKTSKPDLSHLANLKPVKTEFRTVRRGRPSGSNPMDVHVKAAYDAGDALALPITAGIAKVAERQARRAGDRMGYKMSVQVLTAEPGKATDDDVAPLRLVETLPAEQDVWLVIKAEPKPDKPAKDETGETSGKPAVTDPFAGQPTTDDKPTGKSRKPAAVANP
jgi:hypothetical protein